MKIFHTADVHLGLKFSSYPEALAKKLSEARFETLARMVEAANRERCDLFVVAGDLFDNLRVPARDVQRAAKILGGFERAVAVLPGNHDFVSGQADDLWQAFAGAQQDRVRVLSEPRAFSFQDFGLDLTLYAAPCSNKHSRAHALGWLAEAPREKTKFQVGVAHGSFEGLSPDLEGDYYPMKPSDLLPLGMDAWLLGHIHVQFPPRPGPNDRIFYPATPEPDGLDCRHEGRAWLLEISADKTIRARSMATGGFRFRDEKLRVQSAGEIAAYAEKLEARERTLLRLTLSGALPREERLAVGEALERIKEQFLYFQADASALSVHLAPADIDREFARNSYPHRLLSSLASAPADAEALQAAYELLREAP